MFDNVERFNVQTLTSDRSLIAGLRHPVAMDDRVVPSKLCQFSLSPDKDAHENVRMLTWYTGVKAAERVMSRASTTFANGVLPCAKASAAICLAPCSA